MYNNRHESKTKITSYISGDVLIGLGDFNFMCILPIVNDILGT